MLKIAGQAARASLLVVAILMVAGCSKPAEQADETQAAAFAELFKSGFEGHEAKSPANGAEGEAPHLASNKRDGFPFSRSAARTRQAEATVADNLAENFSLRFAMAEPAAFVRSGEVREVYQHELASRNFPADTVAGATALMFAAAWEMANGQKLSETQNAAILRQATEATRGSEVERQGDNERQSQADIALTVAGLWLEEARLRERFPDQMQELSEAVRSDMMKLSGTDMRARKVAAEGFVAK